MPDQVTPEAVLSLTDVHVSVNELAQLKDLAQKQGISLNDALRRAINTEAFIQSRRKEGNKVLLEQNGQLREMVFTR